MKKILLILLFSSSIFTNRQSIIEEKFKNKKTTEKKALCPPKTFFAFEPVVFASFAPSNSFPFAPWARLAIKHRGKIYEVEGKSFGKCTRHTFGLDPLAIYIVAVSCYHGLPFLSPIGFANYNVDYLKYTTPKENSSSYLGFGGSLTFLIPAINYTVGREVGLHSDYSKFIEFQGALYPPIGGAVVISARLNMGYSF